MLCFLLDWYRVFQDSRSTEHLTSPVYKTGMLKIKWNTEIWDEQRPVNWQTELSYETEKVIYYLSAKADPSAQWGHQTTSVQHCKAFHL